MTQEINTQKRNTAATALTLAYMIVTAAIVCAYLFGYLDQPFHDANLYHYKDVITFAVIALLAIAVMLFKTPGYAILPPATFGSFVVLSIGQDSLLRYLILAAVLFAIGMYGMVVSRNAVRVLMSIELMLNAVNINLVAFSRYTDAQSTGQIFAIFILTVAAAEAAVGLAIVLAIYRNSSTVDMERFNLLKW